MLTTENFPVINKNTLFKESLEHMNKTNLGIACVVDERNKLLGIITDGDVRRNLLKVQKPISAFFVDDVVSHCVKNPITILPDDKLNYAVKIMGEKKVWDLPVVNNDGILVGLLHLHQAIKKLLEKDI
ncbi:MAG: CBS domain-containing protein [Pelagibacteraceae bacterium]|nr:CBS domain-containing protein [Pelagibacteraceae bacterium]